MVSQELYLKDINNSANSGVCTKDIFWDAIVIWDPITYTWTRFTKIQKGTCYTICTVHKYAPLVPSFENIRWWYWYHKPLSTVVSWMLEISTKFHKPYATTVNMSLLLAPSTTVAGERCGEAILQRHITWVCNTEQITSFYKGEMYGINAAQKYRRSTRPPSSFVQHLGHILICNLPFWIYNFCSAQCYRLTTTVRRRPGDGIYRLH